MNRSIFRVIISSRKALEDDLLHRIHPLMLHALNSKMRRCRAGQVSACRLQNCHTKACAVKQACKIPFAHATVARWSNSGHGSRVSNPQLAIFRHIMALVNRMIWREFPYPSLACIVGTRRPACVGRCFQYMRKKSPRQGWTRKYFQQVRPRIWDTEMTRMGLIVGTMSIVTNSAMCDNHFTAPSPPSFHCHQFLNYSCEKIWTISMRIRIET